MFDITLKEDISIIKEFVLKAVDYDTSDRYHGLFVKDNMVYGINSTHILGARLLETDLTELENGMYNFKVESNSIKIEQKDTYLDVESILNSANKQDVLTKITIDRHDKGQSISTAIRKIILSLHDRGLNDISINVEFLKKLTSGEWHVFRPEDNVFYLLSPYSLYLSEAYMAVIRV